MHAPHDHAKWHFADKEKLAKLDAKKKSPKDAKSEAGDDTNSTNNDVKHLKISDSIVNGLTTEIMIGDSEPCKIAKRWLKNANEGTS